VIKMMFGKKYRRKFDGKIFQMIEGFMTREEAERWFRSQYDSKHREYYYRIEKKKSSIKNKSGKYIDVYYLYIRKKK